MTEYIQILHDRVGVWNKGQIIPAEELGTPDDLQRLVALGAIVVLSGVFEPEETIIERIVEKVESALDSVLHREPKPEPVVEPDKPVVADVAIVIPTALATLPAKEPTMPKLPAASPPTSPIISAPPSTKPIDRR